MDACPQNEQSPSSGKKLNDHWLNQNVFAFGLTSFLSDFSHEMATAVLPQFIQSIGAFSNRFSRTRYLAVGYVIAAITFLGFAFVVPSLWWFIIFFLLAGIFIAWEDTIEGVAVRDYVDTAVAGTAYGVLGVANGIGDLVSSLAVGLLWTAIGPAWAFGYAAVAGLCGAALMARAPSRMGHARP